KMLIMNGEETEGMELLEELTSSWPDNWRSHYSAAEIYEEASETEKAIKAYEKAIEMAENERTKAVLQQRIDRLK
ncbi:MAG: hypothetical protein RLN81_16010, partial [Balneolaceae bacterium]